MDFFKFQITTDYLKENPKPTRVYVVLHHIAPFLITLSFLFSIYCYIKLSQNVGAQDNKHLLFHTFYEDHKSGKN